MKLSCLMLLLYCHIIFVFFLWIKALMSCPLGASLCTATQLLRVLFVNKCSCIVYCMLYLDPGLRFAQPRLQCLREHLTQIILAAQSFQLSENIWMLVHKRPVYLYLYTSLAQWPSRAGCPLQLIFTIYVSSQQWRSCYLVNVARITSQDLPLFARI